MAMKIVEAQWTDDGRPQVDATDFKEMEAAARGPDVLVPQEMARVMQAKEQGNQHFRDAAIDAALSAYTAALAVYGGRDGGDAEQRALTTGERVSGCSFEQLLS